MTNFLPRPTSGPKRWLQLSLLAVTTVTGLWFSGCGGASDNGSSAASDSDSAKTTSTASSVTPPSPPRQASDSSGSGTQNPPAGTPQTATKAAATGPAAPAFTLPRVGGGKLSLASLKGKVVLLDFWATWCVPCMAELPEFQQLYTKYGSQGLVVVGMTGLSSYRSPSNQVSATQSARHLTFPLVTTDSATETAYHIGSQIPASVLIDRQGHIVAEVHDAPSPSALQFWSPLVEKALKS